MKSIHQMIRILMVILLTKHILCEDGFGDHEILRLKPVASKEEQIEALTSYSNSILQRDPNSQSVSSINVQYHITDDSNKNKDYNRADIVRNRKVYRIKNPFQQIDASEMQQDSNVNSQDNDSGASNQYAAIQYSLPPEDFLQQMRAENQYYQQQQLSTPISEMGYTVTPQPQYQYSTSSNYDNSNQQSNQMPQFESKITNNQNYHKNSNPYQYNTPSSYALDNYHSTPSPSPQVNQYVSTSLPSNQYVGTPANNYVSSSEPIYLSSQPNLQQYVSSPLSTMQNASPDYSNNRVTTTIGSNSLTYNNDFNKKMQIDHYDNAANGMGYPANMQHQNQIEYPTSTQSPSSSVYPNSVRNLWQTASNVGVNTLAKSLQEISLTQYQNSPYNNNQENNRPNFEGMNNDVHRIGNLPSANNVFMNVVQPDQQLLQNLKSHTKDLEHVIDSPGFYSHGDYGWKLSDKRSPTDQDNIYSYGNYGKDQAFSLQPDVGAISHINFHINTDKLQNYDQISKSTSESLEAQEFAKAAAKAHENLKQQLSGNSYLSNYNSYNTLPNINTYYSNDDKQRNNIYSDNVNHNSYDTRSQTDLITASPHINSRENNFSNIVKQPFDHAKALKNIVPIVDVSNVASNSDSQQKITSYGNVYTPNHTRDQLEQSLKQYYYNNKPITDAYYKDKNAGYGFNIKTKAEESSSSENHKLSSLPYYSGTQSLHSYNQGELGNNKRYVSAPIQSVNLMSQASNNHQDVQFPTNIQQSLQLPQNQITSDITNNIFKLNDIPYRLTQDLSADALRLQNVNFDRGIPTPLPPRLNQNVANHQIDVVTNIFSKLMSSKQPGVSISRPEVDGQTSGLLSTVNGFRVANPFNVDMKLINEILKGKSAVDESNMMSLKEQIAKLAPLKLDISQLQQYLLKPENYANLPQINNGFTLFPNNYLDVYGSNRFPYQGVKYSRSQEEEESILPIADSTNSHPIGAVVEQDDPENTRESTRTDLTAQDDESIPNNFEEDRLKTSFNVGQRIIGDKQRHPNVLLSGRHHHKKQHKAEVDEPYPLLKPPSPRSSRNRPLYNKGERHTRRRRVNRPKITRVLKTEPLFEAETSAKEDMSSEVPTLLRPPPRIAEAKSDKDNEENL